MVEGLGIFSSKNGFIKRTEPDQTRTTLATEIGPTIAWGRFSRSATSGTPHSVVLELGPGSGRLTRHLIGRCRELICADYSRMVCKWLPQYLGKKRHFKVHHISKPYFPMIPNESIDVVVANGVFEHIELEDLSFYLEDFYRILKPSGVVSFNYENIMTSAGLQWLRTFRGEPGDGCIFRFYHPDTLRWLSENIGFAVLHVTVDESRFAHIELQKPPSCS